MDLPGINAPHCRASRAAARCGAASMLVTGAALVSCALTQADTAASKPLDGLPSLWRRREAGGTGRGGHRIDCSPRCLDSGLQVPHFTTRKAAVGGGRAAMRSNSSTSTARSPASGAGLPPAATSDGSSPPSAEKQPLPISGRRAAAAVSVPRGLAASKPLVASSSAASVGRRASRGAAAPAAGVASPLHQGLVVHGRCIRRPAAGSTAVLAPLRPAAAAALTLLQPAAQPPEAALPTTAAAATAAAAEHHSARVQQPSCEVRGLARRSSDSSDSSCSNVLERLRDEQFQARYQHDIGMLQWQRQLQAARRRAALQAGLLVAEVWQRAACIHAHMHQHQLCALCELPAH